MVSRLLSAMGSPLAVETLTGEMRMRVTEEQNHLVDTITIDQKQPFYDTVQRKCIRLEDRQILVSSPSDRYQHSRTSSVGRSLQGCGGRTDGSDGGCSGVNQLMALFRTASGARCAERSHRIEGGRPAYPRRRASRTHRSLSCPERRSASSAAKRGMTSGR